MGRRRPWVQQRSGRSATHVKLDVRCRTCGGDNYGRHKYCGWCGIEMGAPAVAIDDVTDLAADDSGIAEPTSAGPIATDRTSPGSLSNEDVTVMRPGAAESLDGLIVSMLGELDRGRPSRSRPVLYRLELGEPFDVDGADIEAPGTFTATVEGLRLDSLGSLEGVYRRVSRDEKPIAYRRLRVIRELGTFQALAPGETIAVGSMAILDRVLVRIEPA